MVSRLTTFKFFAAVILAVAVIFGGYFAVTTVAAHAMTDAQLVELFISLGIIPADKAAAARAALSTSSTTTTTTTTSCSTTFTRNLTKGATGAEVMALQNGFTVAVSGAGSAGNETSTFGPATKAAVIKFQNMYTSDILTPVGLKTGTGYWGASSRAKANMMCSSSTTTTTTGGTTTTTTGGTLVVGSTTQPSQTLAPGGASRVPFTKFTLTNTSSAPVVVNGVTVQLTGLGVNNVFTGVALVDSNNVQYGIAKTLNSNHQAVIGDTFTINAGETKTFTVTGNMTDQPTMLVSYAGQVIGLTVIAINTTATISGSLPIMGALNVTNGSLIIGSVSTSTSAFDPGTAQTKNIGDTAVRFSGLRFTASSVEDVSLYSIRFRQSGTASASDITNVMAYVDGTSYPTTVSADGKYYTAVFPSGLLIQKGFSKDVYIQGDITGSGAAGRTADFDIDKASDVYFVGQTFGYGIAVSGSWTPWFNGNITSINAGTATSISKANEVAAANVATNVQNQILGGFATEFKGEAVSVQSMKFTIATTSVGAIANSDYPTNVSLVNENGAVVAGPADFSTNGSGTLTLSDTVTFPTGRHIYTLKGKIPADWANNGTFVISTLPNSSNWTNAVGQTSGNTISLPGVAVAMNTMTVKAGASTVSISSTPAAQNVVSGVTGLNLANVQFDGTQSGEDVRYTAVKLKWTQSTLTTGNITNCFAYDGTTRLNDTAVLPTVTGTEYTFSFNTFLVVPKGTVKTVAIKCDVPASITSGNFSFGIAAQPGTSSDSFSGTGISSGSSIYPIASSVTGPTMTVAGTGTLTVVADSSTPTYRVVAAGTTGVTLGVLKFHATNESVNLSRVSLMMSNTSASSSPSDLAQVTLWDGATQIGTALFTGTSRFATSTLISTVNIPANTDKIITIKGDMSMIGTSLPGTEGALVQVDYNGADSTGTQGLGTSSGTAIYSASASTAFAGVRNFRSYPTVAQGSVGSSSLSVGSGLTLDRFSVTANAAGSIGLAKVTINIATSSVSSGSGTTSVSNLKVYAYTDSNYSNPVGGSFTNGQLNTTVSNVNSGNNAVAFTGVLSIPAGMTYYFSVKADVAQVAGTNNSAGTVTTKLVGDSAYPILATLMGQYTTVNAQANNNFIWSPNATSTSGLTDIDWTNGYLIPGLPTDYLNGTTLTK
jgi:hypothetical protein